MAEADEKDGNASEGVDDGNQLLNKIFNSKCCKDHTFDEKMAKYLNT